MHLCINFMVVVLLAVAGFGAPAASAQTLSEPEGWKTRAERFVAMPPGFHITTSPSVLFYHPEARAEGEYYVYSEGFLFPGDSPNRYGLFVGGRDLESDAATWTSLELGLDGNWVVRTRRPTDRQSGFRLVELAGPSPAPLALPADGEPAKNSLAVRVGPDRVEFRVNDEAVAELPRADLPVDGVFGLRVGAGLNLHLTTLTIERGDTLVRWAPAADTEGGT